MLATPTPSPEATSSNSLALGGRSSVALRELKRRLETELPPFIEYENTRLGLTGNKAFGQFKRFDFAPSADLTKEHINSLLVGWSANFSPSGSRAWRRIAGVSLYIVEGRWEIGDQFLNALDRSELVMKVLQNYLTDCRDPQGRLAWSELTPQIQAPLPPNWKDFAGVTLNYQLLQSAGNNLWA